MNFLSRLFSKKVEKDYIVQMYYGTTLKWLPVSNQFYSKKDSERLAFYYSRIHPKNCFRSEFAI